MSKSSLSEIEEERRLLYVAITRAKKHCILTYAGQRYRQGQTVTTIPSPFLSDIDSRFMSRSMASATDSYSKPQFETYRDSYHSGSVSVQSTTRNNTGFNQFVQRGNQVNNKTASGNCDNTCLTHTAAELTPGMTIEHSRFGRGIIQDIDSESKDHKITVRFSNADTKVLLLKFAKFNIIG